MRRGPGEEGRPARPHRRPREGEGAADARRRAREAAGRAEGGPVLRAARLAAGPPRDRRGRPADPHPADQPARPDDQLQLQGRPPLRPLHHLPPGDRSARVRQGRRGQADAVGLRRAPPPDRRRHGGRPDRQGGHGRALPRRQRAAQDQQLRVHDLPRRAGVGDRLHLRLARAQRPGGEGALGGEVPLARDPPLGRADAPHPVPPVELPEVPPPGDRRPAGRQAPGGLPADRQVRLHRLPHHRRRGLVRARPDRRAPGRPEPGAPRLEGLAGLGPEVDQEPARLPPRHPDAPLLRPDQQRRQGGLAQEPRRDPRDHPLPVQQVDPADRVRRPSRQGRRGAGQGALPPEGLHGLPRPQGIRTGDLPRVRPRIRRRPTTAPTSRTSRPSSSRRTRATAGWPTGSRPPRRTTPRA